MSLPHAERPRRRVVEAPGRRPPAEPPALRIVIEPDLDPDAASRLNEDGKRAYKKGEFSFVSVRAEADVLIEDTPQTLASAGVSGVESDAEDEYLDEIIAQEWSVLRKVLKTVGVPTDQLPLEASREWIDWRT